MSNKSISPILKPNLRIFFKLNQDLLSEDFIEKIGREEGGTEYVDAEIARDFGWTEEIMKARVGVALVDEDGDTIAEFKGGTALARAEKARSSAKVTFDIDVEEADEAEEAEEAE